MNDVQANPALARRADPATSHAAAAVVHVTARQVLVLRILFSSGTPGLTSSEIAARAQLPRDSISPRIKPLVAQGLLVDSGTRRRPGAQLHEQIVWRLTGTGAALCMRAFQP